MLTRTATHMQPLDETDESTQWENEFLADETV
jgi:hypothetical protein